MIDDEIDRLKRIDQRRIAAELRERIAHRGEVHHRGNTCEILKQHARGSESDLLLRPCLHIPVREGADVVRLDESSILVPQQIFEEDFQTEGQTRNIAVGKLVERVQSEDGVAAAFDVECGPAAEGERSAAASGGVGDDAAAAAG